MAKWQCTLLTVSFIDDESGLHHDFEITFEKLSPEKPRSQYRHNGA